MFNNLTNNTTNLNTITFMSFCSAIIFAWFLIYTSAIPVAIIHGEVSYVHKGQPNTACLFLSEEGYSHVAFQVRLIHIKIIIWHFRSMNKIYRNSFLVFFLLHHTKPQPMHDTF